MQAPRVGVKYSTPVNGTWVGDLLKVDFTFTSAGDLIAGFVFQIINDLFLYNGEDCMFWAFDALTDAINAYLLLAEEDKPVSAF